jgi:hypothetical protein
MLFIERLIFYVYTLLLTIVAFGVTLFCLGVIKTDFVWTSLIVPATGDIKIAFSAALIFVLGFWAVLAGFFRGTRKKPIAHYSLNGNVDICVDAIEAFIEKTARTTAGVRDAKVSVLLDAKNEKSLAALLNVSVGQDAKLEKVSSEMQENIQECVQNALGVELTEIKVVVEAISNEAKIKNRVR